MRKELGMLVALAAMCAVIATSNPNFYGDDNLINTPRQIAMLGIFAIGVSFVIITGGIDLSVGSVIGLTGVIIARLSAPETAGGTSGAGLPIAVGITVAMLVALAIGLVQGLLITQLNLQPFIVTLGGMLFFRGVSQTFTDGGNISFGSSPFREFADSGFAIGPGYVALYQGEPFPQQWLMISWPVILFIFVAIAMTYLLHFTVFGRHVYAIGGNREAARYSGIPVKTVETMTYVISSGLAGLAGVAYASYIGQMSHTVGEAYELIAIAAAVLGGCSLRGGEGTILGVIIGSAVMKVMENGINMFRLVHQDAEGNDVYWRLNENWRYMIIGGVILGAVLLDQMTHMWRDRQRRRRVTS